MSSISTPNRIRDIDHLIKIVYNYFLITFNSKFKIPLFPATNISSLTAIHSIIIIEALLKYLHAIIFIVPLESLMTHYEALVHYFENSI